MSNALGAISAGVEMSLVSARSRLLMLIARYAQEVSSRQVNRRNRTHVDHSLACCSEENSKVLGLQNVVDIAPGRRYELPTLYCCPMKICFAGICRD